MLRGRGDECGVLDRLVADARAGQSDVLVLLGEAGAGKTALLDHAAEAASGLSIVRICAVEAEQELAFAALHQLCGPLLDRLDGLPPPQRRAIRVTFGLVAGPVPDPFLVGLAVLGLLAAAAECGPLVCVVDDAHWLDPASARTLAFVARRLPAEPVLMLFAARSEVAGLRGLPALPVGGLPDADARALLASVVRWPLDNSVREEILAEARGNPLALLDLPAGPAERAGGYGLPIAGASGETGRRLAELPAPARLLLVLAAADPGGDAALMWRAAARLELGPEAADRAEASGLVRIAGRVTFRQPLTRSAVYRAASAAERRLAHRALAEATDPVAEPDRRAWHRGHAVPGRDEPVAAELEASAGRAQERGGLAASAAFLARAAELTPDPGPRADRELAAARAHLRAGAFAAASELVVRVAAGPAAEPYRARIGLLRGQIAFAAGRTVEAATVLLETARELEPADPRLARETYLDALTAGLFVGRFAGAADLRTVAAAARGAPAADPAGAADLLRTALAVLHTDGYPAGAPLIRRAVAVFRRDDLPDADAIRWLFTAGHAAQDGWDDDGWHALSGRYVEVARAAGALASLPIVLSQRVGLHLHAGEFGAAGALVEEIAAITGATGSGLPAYAAVALAGWQGRDQEVEARRPAALAAAASRGEGMALSLLHLTDAVRHNGHGRYAEALTAAGLATAYPPETGFANWALAELVEAAVRCGQPVRAARALDRLSRTTGPSGTEWGLGLEAAARALLAAGPKAEDHYREAIERLGKCRGAVPLARAHLLYGEWLRRENRRVDARGQLHTAYEMFARIGAEAFADRTHRELMATGETVRKRSAPQAAELTPQEREIAGRARSGQSNAEIGAELFLSARTVEWHLRKVFGKLGITSRRELRTALPS